MIIVLLITMSIYVDTWMKEGEVADNFLKNLTKDEKFKNWVEKKRNNRRIKRLLDIIEK